MPTSKLFANVTKRKYMYSCGLVINNTQKIAYVLLPLLVAFYYYFCPFVNENNTFQALCCDIQMLCGFILKLNWLIKALLVDLMNGIILYTLCNS